MNHRNLSHPNIVKFKEVLVTPTHLAVAMEAIGGGELFSYVQQQGKFTESQARYFFQHLISGVEYLHNMRISHRDLKLENTLVDLTTTPVLRFAILDSRKEVSTVSRRHKLGRQRIYRPRFTVAHSRMMAQLQTYGLVGCCCMSC